MDKEETYQYLKEQGIPFEITEHKAVFHMGELDPAKLPYPDWLAKNLFIRDDKKQNYYMITVKGEKRVDLKAFRRQNGLRPLCFASAEDLQAILDLTPGSVTPLGLLNDRQHKVHLVVDAEFAGHKLGIHPNENTATIWLQADDLLELIRKEGNEAAYSKI